MSYRTAFRILKNTRPKIIPIISITSVIAYSYSDKYITSCEGGRFRKLAQYHLEEANSLTDLIKLCKLVPSNSVDETDVMLRNLVEPLVELNKMVGLIDIKRKIVSQILYALNELHKHPRGEDMNDMMNSIIFGNAGVGKTELAKKLGRIYHVCGLVKNPDVILGTRTDFIGTHVGETAHFTKAFLEKHKGHVIIMDEIYSLGDSSGKGYSKECIDEITRFITENKDTIIIISGYKEDVEKYFLDVNQGLPRRFPFQYIIEGYDNKDMAEIFFKKVEDSGYKCDSDVKSKMSDFFSKNKNRFPNYGGDIETYVLKIKIEHSKRITCDKSSIVRELTWKDIESGFSEYKESKLAKQMSSPQSSLWWN